VAIIDAARGADRALSFRELERASARLASLLAGEGLRQGDRVVLLQPMSAELYIALVALFRLGLVATFLDPSAGRGHVARCCRIASPRAFIGSVKAHVLALLLPGLRRIPLKIVIGPALPGCLSWSRADRMEPLERFAPCESETPALITFTSGSTGRPKAAMRSHGFLLAQQRALEQTIGLPAGAVELATLPVFALANLAAGVTSLIPDADLRSPGRVDPAPILAQIDAHRPSRVTASPAFLERIADDSLRHERKLLTFEQVFTGGAPVFPVLLDKLRHVAPRAEIIAVYGSTEAEPIAELSHDEISAEDRAAMGAGRGLLAGRPVAVVALRILPDRGGAPIEAMSAADLDAACARESEPGEIIVSGDHVLSGYLDREGDAETKFRVDGKVWHRTGDAGYLDGTGRLWLLGRCAAVVRDAHGTLYPFAVECAAHQLPGVRRSALLSRDGERILAVEAQPGAAIDAGSIRAELAWAQLDRVVLVKEIPVDKRHNAKVDYTALDRLI
jgi:acyl-CoA synthetase (AMP-forming)/AMP-acid ligase II